MNDHINNLTFEELCQTIDNHFESKTNFLFVVDLDLACDICDYIEEIHGLYAENEELSANINEYYITVIFSEDEEVKMYVESARGNSGKFKLSDLDNDYIDYFIGTDMSENEADKYLLGDGTWSWFKVVEEDDEVDEEESELSDSEDEFAKLVNETLSAILDLGGCPNCILESLLDFGGKCLSLGHSDAVDEIREFLDD